MKIQNALNSSSPVAQPATVFVCTQCGIGCTPATGKPQANPQARQLVRAIRQALGSASSITVRLSRCLGACDVPLAYAFTGPERETLVFTGGANPVTAQTIAQAALTYQAKRPGTRYQRDDIPESQKGTIFARIPAPHKPKVPPKV